MILRNEKKKIGNQKFSPIYKLLKMSSSATRTERHERKGRSIEIEPAKGSALAGRTGEQGGLPHGLFAEPFIWLGYGMRVDCRPTSPPLSLLTTPCFPPPPFLRPHSPHFPSLSFTVRFSFFYSHCPPLCILAFCPSLASLSFFPIYTYAPYTYILIPPLFSFSALSFYFFNSCSFSACLPSIF